MFNSNSPHLVNCFTVAAPASALNAALSLAVLAADKKGDTPVHIVADHGMITFTVTNVRSAMSIRATSGATVIEAGGATMSATSLYDLLSGFAPGTKITVSTSATSATIAAASSKYRLPLLSTPLAGLAIDPEIGRIDLATADCLKLLSVLPAADTGQSRPYLCGLCVHNVSAQLVAAATDGTKLLRVAVTAGPFSTDRTVIIPASTATTVRKILRTVNPDTVTLRRSQAVFAVSAPGFELVSGLVAGPYPAYERIIPQATGNAARVQRADVAAALVRLQAVALDEAPLILLAWADQGPVRLNLARQPQAGQDLIAAQGHGSTRMAFSLQQLMALISEFDDGAIVVEAEADRGVQIRQNEKLAVLMACRWPENQGAAA
jgi:DNA polymerase-3 subunit beta